MKNNLDDIRKMSLGYQEAIVKQASKTAGALYWPILKQRITEWTKQYNAGVDILVGNGTCFIKVFHRNQTWTIGSDYARKFHRKRKGDVSADNIPKADKIFNLLFDISDFFSSCQYEDILCGIPRDIKIPEPKRKRI